MTPAGAQALLDWLLEDESSKSDRVVVAIREELVPLLIRTAHPRPTHRYTAFIAWPDTPPGEATEEIDVDAESPEAARAEAERQLTDGYRPGGRILAVEQRHGLYL